MFAVKTFIAIAAILASTVSAFSTRPSFAVRNTIVAKKTSLSMMWNSQKVRKSVVETTVPKSPEEEVVSNMFRRVPPGSGMDERTSTIASDEELEMDAATISKIDRSFRQHSLKMTLEGDYFGTAEKLNRIHLAAASGVLPESMVAGSSKVVSLSAAGLFKDWESDMM